MFRVRSFPVAHLVLMSRVFWLSSLPEFSVDKWGVIDVQDKIDGDESLVFVFRRVVSRLREFVEISSL